MTDYRFEREARTPYSEVFTIDDGEHSLGRVDVHYTSSATYATLAVHQSVDEDGVQALIAAIDERIISTADPYREDFVVTVWRGEEFGVFADETDFEDEDVDDMDDEEDDDEQ
jgi:hypothetical protein